MYMPRVGSVCVLLRQRAPSPFPPLPCLGGITCCTCRGLAQCVPYGRGGYLTWRVVTVTRHHIMQRDFKIIEKSAMWDVRCQYFVRFFSQVYKSGGRTVQLYQRYVSVVKGEGPEPNPHTVHGTVVDSFRYCGGLQSLNPTRKRSPPGAAGRCACNATRAAGVQGHAGGWVLTQAHRSWTSRRQCQPTSTRDWLMAPATAVWSSGLGRDLQREGRWFEARWG